MLTRPRPLAGRLLVLAGVMAVAFNLRTAINVVGPLVPIIRADLGASNIGLGLIGTIPVLAFGLVSPLAAGLGRRIGIGRSLGASLVLLAASVALRSAGGFGWLVVGTVGLGIAIAIGNVLLPALIKSVFPDRVSQLSTAYTAVLVLAATAAAAVAVPLADAFSWELSAGIWAVPAGLGAIVVGVSVLLDERRTPATPAPTRSTEGMSTRELYRSPLAWQITAFMGLQSAAFYITLAWLSDILISKGLTELQAGTLISVFNAGGLVGVLAFPLLHRGREDQRRSTAAACAASLLGVVTLLVPGTALTPLSAFALGAGAGGLLALALSFFALRTETTADAAAMSGMAQTWGYLISAAGPILWGAISEWTGGWTVPLILLLAVNVAMTAAGLASARNRVIAPGAA